MSAPRTKFARDAAKRLVKEHGLARPVDVGKLAEELGFIVRRERFEDTLSGFYAAKYRVIAVNKLQPPTRQRFTIAHEIGHAILHTDENALFMDDSSVHLRQSNVPVDAREIEANRFAAELLMPESQVYALVSNPIEIYEEGVVALLAREFEVSPQAFTARLVELGLVPRAMMSYKSAKR